ncbi:SdrD B-like domain-containing protein, partial [Chloroflexota bacterium]
DAGLHGPYSIGDIVWHDENGDGQQTGETGITTGVTIQLRDGGNNVLTNKTTDANGNYIFWVPTGTYTVEVTDDDGDLDTYKQFGSPTTCPAGVCSEIWTAAVNGNIDTVDFGYAEVGFVSGTVWRDGDEDGTYDPTQGEYGIGDNASIAHVEICETLNSTVCQDTYTDGDGYYEFQNLLHDVQYTITVIDSTLTGTGWQQTGDPDVATTIVCSTDGNCDDKTSFTVNLGGGADQGEYNFGYNKTGTTSIGDRVYYDWNGNGTYDLLDGPIADIQVDLFEDVNLDGSLLMYVATTNTDDGSNGWGQTGTANENYQFINLPAGQYVVRVTTGDLTTDSILSGGYNQTQDPDESSPCAICNNEGTVITTNGWTGDFGYQPDTRYSVGDFVWWDMNGNGEQDDGEPGANGVHVYLDLDESGSHTTGEPEMTTPANGQYSFSDLPPDTYDVRFDLPSGASGWTTQDGGPSSDDTLDSDVDANGLVDDFDVTGTAPLDSVDAGLVGQYTIGDYVWNDLNGNGIQDGGEVGIPGVTVELRDGTGNLLSSMVTNGSGQYLFSVPSDSATYSVNVLANDPVLAAGNFTQFGDPDAPNQTCGPTTTPCDEAIDPFTVADKGGSPFLGADFGYTPAYTLSGTVCTETAPGNGDCEPDSPVDGVTVILYKDGVEVTRQDTTTGDYEFPNLLPATYVVEVVKTGETIESVPTTTGKPPVTVDDGDKTQRSETVVAADVDNVDFAYVIPAYDFGDLPNSYETTVDSTTDGPRHVVGTLYLGSAIDSEANGVPTADASGDGADDDGIQLSTANWPVGSGTATATVTGSGGWLVGWVDFDGDDSFDASEAFINQAVAAGPNALTYTVPALDSAVTNYYARFRLFPAAPASPATAFKGVVTDNNGFPVAGEVEDYLFTLPDLELTKEINSGSSSPIASDGSITFDIVVTNKGDEPVRDVVISDYLPDGFNVSAASITAGWSVVGRTASITVPSAASVPPAASVSSIAKDGSVTVSITLTGNSASEGTFYNAAE